MSSQDSQSDSKTQLGFWIYLMTDCVLFASLFATFAILRANTFGGPSGQDLFSLPYVLAETMILLTSSFTAGMGLLAMRRNDRHQMGLWFLFTFALGLSFLSLEIHEFINLYNEGNSWRRSGFLTGFFTLVGTHGLHITAGLFWMALLIPRAWRLGIDGIAARRVVMLTVFWHFLDIVWIFIFTVVYMMGAIR